MPAKPLTPEQKADAARLMALFRKKAEEEREKQGKRLSQATLAEELGYTTQSAVSQYLNGKVPLNVDASIRFAIRFGCSVSDFSPSIQREIDRIANFATNRKDVKFIESQSALEVLYSQASNDTQASIDVLLLDQEDRMTLAEASVEGENACAGARLLERDACIALVALRKRKKAQNQ